MPMATVDLRPLVRVLEPLDVALATHVGLLQDRLACVPDDDWEALYKTHAFFVEAIALEIQECGQVTKAICSKLARLREAADELLREKFSVRLVKVSAVEADHLQALHDLGVLTWVPTSGVLTFFKSPRLALPFLRYISRLDESSLTEHLANVAQLRTLGLSAAQLCNAARSSLQNAIAFQKALQKKLFGDVADLLRVPITFPEFERVAVAEVLPTSTDFYFAASSYYQAEAWSSEATYSTFATTSGIIMPEEHFGARYFADMNKLPGLVDQSPKNPIREDYFKVVREAQASKSRRYYLDATRTADRLWTTYAAVDAASQTQASRYLRDSADILRDYLAQPRFELVEVETFPATFLHLTLGNGQNAILSLRDDAKKIAHGIWIRPRTWGFIDAAQAGDWRQALFKSALGGIVTSVAGLPPVSLAVTFAVSFAAPLWETIRRVRTDQDAAKMLFDIRQRLESEAPDYEVHKRMSEPPIRRPEEIIEGLLARGKKQAALKEKSFSNE